MLDSLGVVCKPRITGSDWPDSGRTIALNVATCCASLSNISPGQQARIRRFEQLTQRSRQLERAFVSGSAGGEPAPRCWGRDAGTLLG